MEVSCVEADSPQAVIRLVWKVVELFGDQTKVLNSLLCGLYLGIRPENSTVSEKIGVKSEDIHQMIKSNHLSFETSIKVGLCLVLLGCGIESSLARQIAATRLLTLADLHDSKKCNGEFLSGGRWAADLNMENL